MAGTSAPAWFIYTQLPSIRDSRDPNCVRALGCRSFQDCDKHTGLVVRCAIWKAAVYAVPIHDCSLSVVKEKRLGRGII
jgi:hypothetical protein